MTKIAAQLDEGSAVENSAAKRWQLITVISLVYHTSKDVIAA